MPEPIDFLYGFGLIRGRDFDGYKLTNTVASHVTVRRYQEYRYSITLTFTNSGSGTPASLLQSLTPVVSQEHIIYGIRNPYRCLIDIPRQEDLTALDSKTIVVQLTGHSYRA